MKTIHFRNIIDRKFQKVAFLAVLFVFALCTIVKSQNIDPPLDCYLRADSLQKTIVVELPDTNVISNIEINIGSSSNSDDLFSYNFEFEQNNGLPNGYSYLRIGTTLFLGIGNIEQSSILYSAVRLQYSGSSWSNWFQFISY